MLSTNMDINIDQIRCSKPRKNDNTYVCQMYVDIGDNKRENLTLPFESSKITHIKHAYQPGDYMLYVKNKGMHDMIYDISNYIIEYVKRHCSEWFGNNMNPELLDDYFSNPLIYTKDHGEIIRLKCINSPNINEYIDKCSNIYITLCNLRFYKQKFTIECKVEDIQPGSKGFILEDKMDDDDLLFESDEDIPEPPPDVIKNIKESYELLISSKQKETRAKIEEFTTKLNTLNSIQNKFQMCADYKEIIKLCNQIEEITGQ